MRSRSYRRRRLGVWFLLGLVVVALMLAPGWTGAADAAAPTASAPAASAPPTHRPLRENVPPRGPEPMDPEVFAGYPAATPFTVTPRQQALVLFPCSQCHNPKVLPLNTTPRKLVGAPHNATLKHGKGRFWCLDCHLANDRDNLHTIGGTKVAFDQSYLVCGQCHSARQRDWTFGGHGKRVAGWGAESRQVYACTHCHDPHDPLVQPRAPSKPPPLRAGLSPMQTVKHESAKPWQRAQETNHVQQANQP